MSPGVPQLALLQRRTDPDTRGSAAPGCPFLSQQWDVLGPFQIGTREVLWGADPLEQCGGFRSLSPSEDSTFPSSLGPDGLASWSRQALTTWEHCGQAFEAKGQFEFPHIDWQSLQSVFGWSALQYQGWARSELYCNAQEARRVAIYTDNVLEFWIDDDHFFGGDFFAFRKAPVIVSLEPGRHRFDVRLVRDLRSLGGVGSPVHSIAVRLEVCAEALAADVDKALVPEYIQGRGFPAEYCSVPVRNTSQESIQILHARSLNSHVEVKPLDDICYTIRPGQTRPYRFSISAKAKHINEHALRIFLSYTIGMHEGEHYLHIDFKIQVRQITEPIKSTFLHPSGVVAYCVILPPAENVTDTDTERKSLPVLVNMHGAGREAQEPEIRHQLDAAGSIAAWTVIPEGGTPWSGDDWHVWGLADVMSAVHSVVTWIKAVAWKGPGIDLRRWFLVGHSNGGQGVWCLATHFPDLVKAAAPCSAYTSIQAYVSYNMWNEMDPRITACMQVVLSTWRNELLLPNSVGIPIYEQHGSADDNVPVSHSRRMYQLLDLVKSRPQYNELHGKNHYYEGIMTTPFMCRLYQRVSGSLDLDNKLPQVFRLVIPNTHMTGGRGGIQVDQLESSTQLGYMDVDRQMSSKFWKLKTSNIHRFHLSETSQFLLPDELMVDGSIFTDISQNPTFERQYDGSWALQSGDEWKQTQRHGRQRGSLEALLSTNGPFFVRASTTSLLSIALQISRNLFQYFGADSVIGTCESLCPSYCGNRIVIAMGDQDNFWRENLPITKTTHGLSICDRSGKHSVYPLEAGLGVIFLAPLPLEMLEVSIWGCDIAGIQQAARLLPTITGAGQPDFVVVSQKCRWQGAGGVKAVGFFDYDWKVSEASYFQ